MNSSRRVILVTGFEPFAGHVVNPSAEVAKALDGRVVGSAVVRSAVLPVHHAEAIPAVVRLVEESDPLAIVHLGLARSEEHTSELQSRSDLVCRLLLEKKKRGACQRITVSRGRGSGLCSRPAGPRIF